MKALGYPLCKGGDYKTSFFLARWRKHLNDLNHICDTNWCTVCHDVFLCNFFSIYHQARNLQILFGADSSSDGRKEHLAFWCQCAHLLHLCAGVLFVCWRRGGSTGPWETGGLTRMYGCFKIHLQAFFYCHSPLLSAHNTPHPIF